MVTIIQFINRFKAAANKQTEITALLDKQNVNEL